MSNKKQTAIDRFLNTTPTQGQKNSKKVVLDEREGLIERMDRILVTKDGKQLLREQY
jgi:hypothetical protein